MRRRVAALAALALLGCEQRPAAPAPIITADQQDAHSPEQENISWLQNRTFELENEVQDVMRGDQQYAYLTPQDHGYSGIQTTVGTLTVSLKDVSAYANGSRIRLQLGNPLTATLTRFRAHIAYGTGSAFDSAGTTRQTDYIFREALMPGTWHTYTIDLAGIPPARLGFVTIGPMSTETITLSGD
jgi:hypothetical protein